MPRTLPTPSTHKYSPVELGISLHLQNIVIEKAGILGMNLQLQLRPISRSPGCILIHLESQRGHIEGLNMGVHEPDYTVFFDELIQTRPKKLYRLTGRSPSVFHHRLPPRCSVVSAHSILSLLPATATTAARSNAFEPKKKAQRAHAFRTASKQVACGLQGEAETPHPS